MKPFKISSYLKKYQNVIIGTLIVVGILSFVLIQVFVQKYKAQAIIKYNYEGAVDNLTPDGSPLDTSEIYSSNIVVEVMDNLNLDKREAKMDVIRSAIEVTPLYTAEQLGLEAAKIESAQADYEKKTDTYLVSFSTNIFEGEEYTRTVLNEVLDVYTKWFAENHCNYSGEINDIKDINKQDYDYYELVTIIDESIEENFASLVDKVNMEPTYRAYNTGYGFSDIYNELDLIKKKEIPRIASKILSESITKNKAVMLSKYQAQNSKMSTQNEAILDEIEHIDITMDTYVELMDVSGNTSIDSDYILDQVYDTYDKQENGDRYGGETIAEYDRMMEAYIDDRYQYEKNLIDIDFNNYLTQTFKSSNVPDVKPDDPKAVEIERQITNLLERVNKLYDIFYRTNDEFNEYLGAKYVNNLSTTSVSETIPVVWLTLGIVFVFGILGCGIAIVVGRIGDIVDYYAYTDHIDGLPNRTKLDRFLEEKGKKSLVDDYASVTLKLDNLHQVNVNFGRDSGDSMIKNFAEVLTQVFEPSELVFVANNGPGQYCVFAEGYNSEDICNMLGRLRRDVTVKNKDCEYDIEYSQGFAVSNEDKCYEIKSLMLLARKKMQASVSVTDDNVQEICRQQVGNSNQYKAETVQNSEKTEAYYPEKTTEQQSPVMNSYYYEKATEQQPPVMNSYYYKKATEQQSPAMNSYQWRYTNNEFNSNANTSAEQTDSDLFEENTDYLNRFKKLSGK